MTNINGATGLGLPCGGPNVGAALEDLVKVLREHRSEQRETEQQAGQEALEAAESRADHAREKADALRGKAWLQFGMAMASLATSSAGLAVKTAATHQGCESKRANRQAADESLSNTERQQLDAIGDSHTAAENHLSQVSNILDRCDQIQGTLGEAALAADDGLKIGFGGRANELEADMAEDDADRQSAQARADRGRDARQETEDLLNDTRQAYRDMTSNSQGQS